jgi:hypothetical protein
VHPESWRTGLVWRAVPSGQAALVRASRPMNRGRTCPHQSPWLLERVTRRLSGTPRPTRRVSIGRRAVAVLSVLAALLADWSPGCTPPARCSLVPKRPTPPDSWFRNVRQSCA